MYDINFTQLISWLIPPVFKSNYFPLLLNAFMTPIKRNYRTFIQNKTDTEYLLEHNSQVCYLSKVLNDRFDLELREVQVVDSQRHQQLYIYIKDDKMDVSIYTKAEVDTGVNAKGDPIVKKFIRPRTDFADTGVDFSVIVPERIKLSNSQEYEMKSLINSYKLAGKRYKIVVNN